MSDTTTTIPLIIGGRDIVLHSDDKKWPISSKDAPHLSYFQGVTPDLAIEAVETAAAAFPSWAQTPPAKRRQLLLDVAKILRNKSSEVRALIEDEIHCSPLWSQINLEVAVGLIEESAALISDSLMGAIPQTQGNSYALVFKDPLGVVLGIAPWNAPLILGLRAVVPVVAAGNGSELSPRTHYLIASLFREAGFPPGVVNFLLHLPQDAGEIYDTIIKRPEIRKCNFTGSTQVGRIIASKAALALKPVLLELGGKNFSVVLADADLDSAAEHIIRAAFLNNGQICMSTDLVYVVNSVAELLIKKLLDQLLTQERSHKVISAPSLSRLTELVTDAKAKGAVIHQASNPLAGDELAYPATIIEGVTPDMDFHQVESFGPVFAIVVVDSEMEALKLVQSNPYGLSAAIFTQNHFNALELARQINAGAVHVNSGTVHDEATLPHGGHGDTGWGRFGARWGLEEFLQTRTVILNK